jgi:hypothetical protein
MNPSNTTQARRAHETVSQLSYHLYCIIQNGGQGCDGSCHRGSPESGPGVPCEDCVKSSQTKLREAQDEIVALAQLCDLMIPLIAPENRAKLAEAARREVLGEEDCTCWIGC